MFASRALGQSFRAFRACVLVEKPVHVRRIGVGGAEGLKSKARLDRLEYRSEIVRCVIDERMPDVRANGNQRHAGSRPPMIAFRWRHVIPKTAGFRRK